MYNIIARNVPEAYAFGLNYLHKHGKREDSRAGPVLVVQHPVVTTYLCPTERVLFDPKRDANPFFHLAESMWMLQGRDDASFLNNYVRDFGERFAEPSGEIHDAYGWRWKNGCFFDQLATIANRLKKDPTDRQCVLQMWDGNEESKDDLNPQWRTRPCNTHCYFRVRYDGAQHKNVLDIMVCCRSNDMIWGGYGANAVQFSFLLEYMAAMIGVGVGVYDQVSFNFHAYESALNKIGVPAVDDRYVGQYVPVKLVEHAPSFLSELDGLITAMDSIHTLTDPQLMCRYLDYPYMNPFLSTTVMMSAIAMRMYRLGQKQDAYQYANFIFAPDWRAACTEWLRRRIKHVEE